MLLAVEWGTQGWLPSREGGRDRAHVEDGHPARAAQPSRGVLGWLLSPLSPGGEPAEPGKGPPTS